MGRALVCPTLAPRTRAEGCEDAGALAVSGPEKVMATKISKRMQLNASRWIYTRGGDAMKCRERHCATPLSGQVRQHSIASGEDNDYPA